MTTSLRLGLPGGVTRSVAVRRLFNAGYSGRAAEEVRAHVVELSRLGVPEPDSIPALYPLPPHLAVQTDHVQVQHGKTSGEAEWALVVGEDRDDLLLTVACDHTDRALRDARRGLEQEHLPRRPRP